MKVYPPEVQERFETTVAKYPHKQAALLTCLWIAQETDGWVSLEAMEYIAKLLEIPVTHVYSVIGFYSMYHTKPIGKHHIQVCHTLSCELRGAEKIISAIETHLGIKSGETTPDGLFTLSRVECLASCGTAPMCQIDRTFHENLTESEINAILDRLRLQAGQNDAQPASSAVSESPNLSNQDYNQTTLSGEAASLTADSKVEDSTDAEA